MKRSDPELSSQSRHPIAADGGLVIQTETTRDPYEVLDDLMAVIEVLCPVWPARETFTGTEQFKL